MSREEDVMTDANAFRKAVAECYDASDIDQFLVNQAAEVLELIAELRADVATTGLTVLSARGTVAANPSLRSLRDARAQFAQLYGRLFDDGASTKSNARSAARARWNRA